MRSFLPAATAVAMLVVAGCFAAPEPVGKDAGSPVVQHASLNSFDGTPIAITVFRPAGAGPDNPVPLVVYGHGWAGARVKDVTGYVELLVDDGFGVVTFDARGHGESGGAARIQDPNTEIRDVTALFDWLHDRLDWVEKEPDSTLAKDFRVGGLGGSYGGAWQLLSEGLDGRLDAIVPAITWHDLPGSLAPNGAVKSAWIDILYFGALSTGTRMHPDFNDYAQDVAIRNAFSPEAVAALDRASTKHVLANVTAPTLLIQGVPDTLFNVDEALATYAALTANGTTVRLFTHLGGHVLSPSLVYESPGPDLGFPQPDPAGSPCGDLFDLTRAWFREHLRGETATEAVPAVSFALDDRSCLRLATLPADSAGVILDGPFALPASAGSLTVPVLTVEEPLVLVGQPVVVADDVTIAGPDDIAYFSLVAVSPDGERRTLSGQVTPWRFAGPGSVAVNLTMGTVGAALEPGDQLVLRIDRVNEVYWHNSGRVPGGFVMSELRVDLPVVTP